MLAIQAHTLDTIFNELARRSSSNMTEGYGEAAERYMRLALKAQSQCRTTIETLSEMKNPTPVAFVEQADSCSWAAAGEQHCAGGTLARGIFDFEQNKLLEQQNGERLDIGTAGTAIRQR